MDDNFLLTSKFNKATVIKAISKYSKMGLDEVDDINNDSKIEFKKFEDVSNSETQPTQISDIKLPKVNNKIITHTKSLNSLQIKPSDIAKSKSDDNSVRQENKHNVLNINVIKTDRISKSIAILTRITMGQIHNVTTINLQNLSNTVRRLNDFDSEINLKFYNNISRNLSTFLNNLGKVNDSITSHIKHSTASLKSNIFKEKFQSLMYVENMFNINELKEKVTDMVKSATMGMKYDMIKSFVKVGIASPISMVVTAAIKKLIPEEIRNVFKSIDSIPTVISTSIGIQFKKMKDSDNPLVAWIGSKLLPQDDNKRNLYKKGIVSFDTFTKMAITKNIPTLLINWLQAADPSQYKDGLAYDYNEGRFVTGSAVDQYFKQFDYSKRMKTLKDANRRTKLLKEQSKNYDRFSVNDVKFTKNLVDDYSHIYNGREDQDKYFENTLGKMTYELTERQKNKFKFKEDGFVAKSLEKFYKGLNIIDNFIFGKMDMEESVISATDKFFRLKDTHLVKQGKIALKSSFDKLMDNIFLPLLEGAAKIINKGKTVMGTIFKRAITLLDEQVFPVFGEHLGKGFIPAMINKITTFFKEKFLQPIKDKFKDIEKSALEKFGKAVRTATKWINEEADKIKSNKKVVNNFSNVVNTANQITNIEPENLAFYGFNTNNASNTNLHSPKSININTAIVDEDNTIVTMPIKRYIKGIDLAKSFIEKMNVDLAKFRRYHKAYTLVMTDAMIQHLKNEFTGIEWHGFDNNEEFRRELVIEDSRLLFEKVKNLTPNIILDIKNHKDEIYLWSITQKINASITDRTLGAVGLSLGKYGLGGAIARGTKALAKWSAVKIATTGINTIRHVVGLAGHAAKVYHFVKTFKTRAAIKLLEVGTQYLLPALNEITKKFGPSIIHFAGSAGSKLINIAGSLAQKMFKAIAKAVEFTTSIAGSVITKITGAGFNLINKIFNRTGKIADGDHRYIGHVIGGYLDFIEEPIPMHEILPKVKYDDDEDEIKSNESIAGKAKNTILGRIGKRLSIINKFINKLISKAVDSSLDFITEGFVNVTSFILGGTVGTFIAEQGGKATQDAEDFGYERIFITGGSVNGGIVGDIADSILDNNDIDLPNNKNKSNSKKKKGIVSKITSFVSGHKKEVGIVTAVVATVAAGFAIFKNKKNKDENETEENETEEILNEEVVPESTAEVIPVQDNISNSSTAEIVPAQDAVSNSTNETVITPVSQIKGVSTTVPSESNNENLETKTNNTSNINNDNTTSNNKNDYDSREINNSYNVNLDYKKSAVKKIGKSIVSNPLLFGPVGTIMTVAPIVTKSIQRKHNEMNNITNVNEEIKNEKITEIELNNTINPYGTNTLSINTQLSEPKKNKINVSDMVDEYKRYILTETTAERNLYNTLTKKQRKMYNAETDLSAFTNDSIYTDEAIRTIGLKRGVLSTIGGFLVNIGKGLVGIVKSGFRILKAVADTTIGVFKNVAGFVKQSLSSVFGGLIQVGKNLMLKFTDNSIFKKVFNLFGIGNGTSQNGTGNGGGSGSGSGNNGGGSNNGGGGGSGSVGQIPSNISTAGFAWPVPESSKISSPFGPRNISVPGASKDHKGIDISGGGKQDASGYKIVASKAGKVTYAGPGSGYGNYIVIDHGDGYTTRYAHMHSSYMFVKAGDTVSQGQHIANIGNQGVSGGPHLHFEVRVNGTAYDPSGFVSYGSGNADRTLGANETGTTLTVPPAANNIRSENKNMETVIDPEGEEKKAKENSKILYKKPVTNNVPKEKEDGTFISNCDDCPSEENNNSSITNISVDETIDSAKNSNIVPSVTSNNIVDLNEYKQQKIINAKKVVTNNIKVSNTRNDEAKYNEIALLLSKLNELMEEYSAKDKKITIATEKVKSINTSTQIMDSDNTDDFKNEMKKIDRNIMNILQGV